MMLSRLFSLARQRRNMLRRGTSIAYVQKVSRDEARQAYTRRPVLVAAACCTVAVPGSIERDYYGFASICTHRYFV